MKIGIVKSKEKVTDYEAGSGSLYIPILGDLFPKLFGQEMNPVQKWFIIVDNTKYTVDEELYNRISEGDSVEIEMDRYGMPEVKLLKM